MRKINFSLLLILLCLVQHVFAQRKMEFLDRGLVAVKVTNGVFVSWRILGTDPSTISFNIYRDNTKVNSSPITGASNLTDAAGTISSTYSVKPIINGVEQASGGTATVWATQGLTIQLKQPAGGTTPDAVAYTYSPNDCSVGDVDGDGQWEILVKWDPSNSKDNSQSGYTGNVFIDCYKLNGTQLWRIDLGINIRAGAHYTQFLVGDYDADGKAEIVFKTAPGTKDGTGTFLSQGPAATDDDATDYRNSSGYILSGPEYLSIFNGLTGKEMATVNFNPARGTVSSWGDSYGNRVDRFLAMNAYLDGVKPSIVYDRGYYTRMAVTAWDWNGTTLSQRWYYNAPTSGQGGYGQGNHNWTCGDVDGDGKDEIIHGACAIDDNGTFMYRTGLGHGDAIHMGEMDINNPGLEVWEVHEEKTSAYGYELHDAKTGKILWGSKTGTDNGRGNAADVDANSAGYEMWSAANYNTYSYKGDTLATSRPSYNFRVYWDGDLQDELLDGNKLDKWNGTGSTRLITFTGNSCNTTKATPNLSADIIGDWREEVILHDGASKLYLYTTTIPTTNRMYTLMHNPNYRNAISWQNTAYNQPPHLSFWLGKGVASIPNPDITFVTQTTCNSTALTSYYKINTGSWKQGTNATVVKGDQIILGPQPTSGGSWSWAGAGTSGTNREQTITMSTVGTYTATATYTNTCGAKSTIEFSIQVNSLPTDCNGTENGTASIDTCGICAGGTTGITPNTSCIPDYTIETAILGEGAITPTAGTYQKYSTVTLTATPSSGWQFNQWTGDFASQQNPAQLTLLKNMFVVGNFSIIDPYQWFTYEAERGVYNSTSAVLEAIHAGYTGEGYVNTTNELDINFDIIVDVPIAGFYDVRMYYANGATDNRTVEVLVNNTVQVNTVNGNPTGAWTKWATQEFQLNLSEGKNSITFNALTASGAPNIDKIELQATISTNLNKEGKSTFVVYPNPARDELIFNLPAGRQGSKFLIFNLNEEVDVSITSMLGQNIFNSTFNIQNLELGIDVSQIPAGIYFIKVGDQVQKVIIQK